MPRILKLLGIESINEVKMTLDTFSKRCDVCARFMKGIEFYKNKSKNDGLHNRCKDCMDEYKKNKKLGIESEQRIIKKDTYFIPDIYLVGYGRHQTYQVCCLSCNDPFFCLTEVKEYNDLFCDDCQNSNMDLPEKNLSKTNLVGHIVGWLAKIENPSKKRTNRNYKKCYERDRYTCQYCGYNLSCTSKFLPLHIDHIIPWSSQGGNALSNLVVSCQDCNLIASDKWFSTFEEKKEFILYEKKRKFGHTS